AEAVRESAMGKKLDFVVETAANPLWVAGDGARLRQVVMNLVVNAVNHTESGGQGAVRCRQREGEIGIEVADTGVGIAPDSMERIFEPFQKGAAEWFGTGSGPGLGLGLAIARRIVEMHAGKIWGESDGFGSGSSLHVLLPAAPAAEETPSQ